MTSPHVPSGFGVILIGVGLFTAFVLGDSVPGMVLAGWIVAFTGMMALTYGDSTPGKKDAR